jgi:chromosome segregation ATPase
VILWDIVRRALDVREARAARERAEQNYRHLLVKHMATLKERRQERFADADADLLAADAQIATLDEQLRNALKAHREALDRCSGLEKQLDALVSKNTVAHRIEDMHREATRLPPPVNRDRQALSRLAAENDSLREQLQEARQRAVDLEKQLEGNPS